MHFCFPFPAVYFFLAQRESWSPSYGMAHTHTHTRSIRTPTSSHSSPQKPSNARDPRSPHSTSHLPTHSNNHTARMSYYYCDEMMCCYTSDWCKPGRFRPLLRAKASPSIHSFHSHMHSSSARFKKQSTRHPHPAPLAAHTTTLPTHHCTSPALHRQQQQQQQ